MWPTIEDGDTVIVRSVDPAELRTGMIAVGIYPEALIVHRIVDVEVNAKGDRLFTFDADNGSLPDRVPASRILGLAEARVPRLGGRPVTLLPATELLSRSRWWQWLANDSQSSRTRRGRARAAIRTETRTLKQ